MSVSTEDNLYVCSFVYNGSLSIRSTLLNGMFGILTLAHLPLLLFAYTGRWKIHKRYVQAIRNIGGYTSVVINGKSYPISRFINMQFTGDVQVLGNTVSRQDNMTFAVPSYRTDYVASVNNICADKLILLSADLSIVVSLPVVNDSTVTIYINTRSSFPTCED